MASISIKQEDQIEGTSNFNTWNARVLNIIQKHDLDTFMNLLVEDPTTDEWKINFKKS